MEQFSHNSYLALCGVNFYYHIDISGQVLIQFMSSMRHEKEGQFSNCFKFPVWRKMKATVYPSILKTSSLVAKEKEIPVEIFTQDLLYNYVSKIPRIVDPVGPSKFRTQDSFNRIKEHKKLRTRHFFIN